MMRLTERRKKIARVLRKVAWMERVKAMRKYGEPFLDCDVVAEMAMPLLAKEGIMGEIVVGDVRGTTHAWIETERFIVDPTSSQFGLPKIRMRKPS